MNCQDDEGAVYHGLREMPGTARLIEFVRDSFNDRYPDVKFQPLTIVMAAYNESESIGWVLDEIPEQICDMGVSCLVIDDASTDGTAELARRHGALVCQLPSNHGQGVALRLGYQIAYDHGATYIATLDADGQWDPADLTGMVEIIAAGRADVVVGSRQMAGSQKTSEYRNEQVSLFAWIVSKLTGTKLTDASSGLRLIRAEVAAIVPQTQPQYHTLEFMVGAILRGFRVAEVPTTMRERTSGKSRKGGASLRMLRYSQVIARTWWCERRTSSWHIG